MTLWRLYGVLQCFKHTIEFMLGQCTLCRVIIYVTEVVFLPLFVGVSVSGIT